MLRRVVPRRVVLGLRGRAAPAPRSILLVPLEPVRAIVAAADDLATALKAELAESHRQRDEARAEAQALRESLAQTPATAPQGEPGAARQDHAELMARQAEHISELDASLAATRLERDELRTSFEAHLKERAEQRAVAGGLNLVTSLQEANQGLRARLRTETDRANRAERRAAAAEQGLAVFTAPGPTGGRRRAERPGPGIVTVDGVEVVVPWGSGI
jgi:hypothetical protein